jgi:hypothetical protein
MVGDEVPGLARANQRLGGIADVELNSNENEKDDMAVVGVGLGTFVS